MKAPNYFKISLAIFLLTLPLVNPLVRGDGVGYYAYVRSLLVQHNLRFETDWLHSNWPFVPQSINVNGRIDFLYTPTGHLPNHFAIGSSILWAPFLVPVHLVAATGIRQGVLLELHKQMPLGSGLGSSAASAVAGVFAANALFNYPLETRELLPFAMEGERIACGSAHADNVAPALMGGFVLIRSYAPLDIVCIPAPDELYCTLVHPFIEIRTEDARRVLKKYIPLKSAVAQWGNVAGLVTGLLRTDYGLIGRSLQDHVVEPERSLLIPGFAQVKAAATRAGAIGCGISGSGPALFAISTHFETSQTVAGAMKAAFADIKIEARAYVSKINNHGPEIRR